MTNHKLTKAIALAITGTALAAGGTSSAFAGLTMYNTFKTAQTSDTDGWTRVYDADGDGVKTGPESQGNKGDIVPWVGVANEPFGYTGSQHLNWAVQLNNPYIDHVGDSAEISAADSQQYTFNGQPFTAEIDTGGGAWLDNGTGANGLPTANGPTGWKHQTDIGLIQTDYDGTVTLKLSTLGAQDPTFSRFGVTIFTGMNTSTADFSHHGAWNCPGCSPAIPFAKNDPFFPAGVGSGLTYLTHSDNVDALNGLTFPVLAGQTYSVFLGGVGFARWNAAVDGYQLDITSTVPEPATFSLFGIALAGMGAMRRRKNDLSAT